MDSPSSTKNIMQAPPSEDPFADLDIVAPTTKELPSPMEFGSGAAVPTITTTVTTTSDEPNKE